jgi:putative heme iron utilization protein
LEDKEASRQAAVADAKRLLRLARTGALATLDTDSGAPLVTLVGVASDFCGSPLFLMSSLSRHSRNVARDPRVSLLLSSPPDRGDPLNHPRLTLGGAIERLEAAIARGRYLQRNPKAKLYASFSDFALYRLRIDNVHFNGGFGRADLLEPHDILASRAGEDQIVAEEARILDGLNALDSDRLAALAGLARPSRRALKAVGIDSEGFDLASGALSYRVQFAAAALDAASWREALRGALSRLDAGLGSAKA